MANHGIKYKGEIMRFCPWCGKALSHGPRRKAILKRDIDSGICVIPKGSEIFVEDCSCEAEEWATSGYSRFNIDSDDYEEIKDDCVEDGRDF
jgi:hypothetical protein